MDNQLQKRIEKSLKGLVKVRELTITDVLDHPYSEIKIVVGEVLTEDGIRSFRLPIKP